MTTSIRYEQREDGKLAAWVFDGADRVLLRRCAELIEQELGAEACERFDGGDQVFWDFQWMATALTLLLDRQRGIAVLSADGSRHAETLARRAAEHLKARIQR